MLAGGASRRMGRDKATLPWPGPGPRVSMLEHTLAVLAERCAPVFVVAAPGQALPDSGAATVLRDDCPGLGPLAATGQGLRAAAAAGCRHAFVCAVDMPALSAALIDELAAHLDADAVLAWDGREHYLAAIYRTDLADRIAERMALGERRMRALTDIVCTRRVAVSDPGMLANVNTPPPDGGGADAGARDQS